MASISAEAFVVDQKKKRWVAGIRAIKAIVLATKGSAEASCYSVAFGIILGFCGSHDKLTMWFLRCSLHGAESSESPNSMNKIA
jgi:hypothetical protein